jgi:hypothetical protein
MLIFGTCIPLCLRIHVLCCRRRDVSGG